MVEAQDMRMGWRNIRIDGIQRNNNSIFGNKQTSGKIYHRVCAVRVRLKTRVLQNADAEL